LDGKVWKLVTDVKETRRNGKVPLNTGLRLMARIDLAPDVLHVDRYVRQGLLIRRRAV
jgi:hypothetical protein